MRKLKIEVRRSELSSHTIFVGAWELGVLHAVHGPGNIIVKGEVDFPEIKWPTRASEEHARLCQVYGGEEGTEKKYAEVVFGEGMSGHTNLGDQIRKAIAAAKAKPPKTPPPDVPQDDGFDNPEDEINADEIESLAAGGVTESPTTESSRASADTLVS